MAEEKVQVKKAEAKSGLQEGYQQYEEMVDVHSYETKHERTLRPLEAKTEESLDPHYH